MVSPQRLCADAARHRANFLRATRALFATHGEAVARVEAEGSAMRELAVLTERTGR